MAVYRYLPIPSDRMGFLWAVTNIDGVSILEFGPMGTTNFATRHMDEAPIFSTHISDSVITFGDSRNLEAAIHEMERRIAPKLIFVMQSSSTSIIGFDMEGFCAEVQERCSTPILPVNLSGLKNDFTVGMSQGMCTLMSHFLKPRTEKRRTFNILGALIDDLRIHCDVKEIARMMKGAFRMEPELVFPCEATIDAIEGASNASLSLVLRKEADACGEMLRKSADIPVVKGMPLGIEGTEAWLREVGKVLGEEPDPEFLRQEKERLTALSVPKIEKACILTGEDSACAWAAFLRNEWGIENLCSLSFEKGKPTKENVSFYTEKTMDEYLFREQPDLVIGNSILTERNFSWNPKKLNIRKFAYIPRRETVYKDGYLGYRGYENIIRHLNGDVDVTLEDPFNPPRK